MGLFDSIKDALTTDDAERYDIAAKNLERDRAELERIRKDVGDKTDAASLKRVERAEKTVSDGQAVVDELAKKAGVAAADPAAEAEARATAQADAEATAQREAEAVQRIKDQQRKYAEQQAADKAAADQAAAEKAAAEQAAAAPVEAAPVETEPLVATEPALREHTVVKGDTLSAIGKKYGVKWRDIAALNDVKNPDLIFPGQVFKIPNA